MAISVFKDELSVWTVKFSTHLYVKNIQRKTIKAEKENAKKDPYHLFLQIDFAENWAVIHNKAVRKIIGLMIKFLFSQQFLIKEIRHKVSQ